MTPEEFIAKRSPLPVHPLLYLYAIGLLILPCAIAIAPAIWAGSRTATLAAVAIAPLLYLLAFVITAGALSRPFQRAIVPIKAPRDLGHFVYGPRRLYGLCWSAVFYSGVLYQFCLGLPALRWLTLWLFGYRGSNDVALAPDAWLRDLPVLRCDAGAYVANKATLGTNICLPNGWIVVDEIKLGKSVMIGHGAVLGPGATFGANSAIGVNGMLGIRSRLGTNVRVGIRATLSHQLELGDDVVVENAALLGLKAKIAAGLRIPFGAVIPERAVLNTQEDVQRCIEAEGRSLRVVREEAARDFEKSLAASE